MKSPKTRQGNPNPREKQPVRVVKIDAYGMDVVQTTASPSYKRWFLCPNVLLSTMEHSQVVLSAV